MCRRSLFLSCVRACVLCLCAQRLTGHQLHQLQLDVCALRSDLPSLLPSAESDTIRALYLLLDETVNSAQERAPGSLALDEPELRGILEQSRRDKIRAAEAAAHAVAPTSVQHSPQPAHASGASSFYADAAAASRSAAALPAHVAVGPAAGPAASAARPNNPAAPTGALARLVLSPPGVQQHNRGGSSSGAVHGPPH